jgi:MFS family permease
MSSQDPAPSASAYPREAYGWYVVTVLILVYTLSYVDRTILTLMVKPIRATLQITDLQISLLHGLAFAVFYTLLGVPIARLADRRSRRNLILGGLVLWSAMTSACGMARSFGSMFLARVGVGVGEATLSPSAYSMLSDYFPPNKLTRALSVYSAAIYIGAGLALIGGGTMIALVPPITLPVIGLLQPWQSVFLLVGLPGLPLALLLLTVREPARIGRTAAAASLRDVFGQLRSQGRAYGFLIGGYALSSLMWNGAQGWIPTFFIRTFGWTPAQTGLRYGSALLVFGALGVVGGGLLAGYRRNRGKTLANLEVGVLSALAAAPFAIIAPLLPTAEWSMAAWCGFIFFGSFPYGAAAAAFQEITPNQMRAQVSAIYLLGINLAGIGLGPTVVAFFTDKVFGNDLSLRYSLALTAALAAPFAALLLAAARRPYAAVLQNSAAVETPAS